MKKHYNFKSRVGEKYMTNEGYEVEIIEYFGANNCTIKFNDDTISRNKKYRHVKNGNIQKPLDLNIVYTTTNGCNFKIIDDTHRKNLTIEFENGYIKQGVSLTTVKKGNIQNPYCKSVCGVGYLGEGEYKTSRFNNEKILYYYKWQGMLERCYSNKALERKSNYKGVTVCEEWHNFQVFAQWFEENFSLETMQGWHLDKDILAKGNKIYSPETCCIVPIEINNIFVRNRHIKRTLPIGVRKVGIKYVAEICIFNKNKNLGVFKTIEEAFQVYKTAKEQYIKEVADKWKDLISDQVYEAMHNYQVEITD